MSEDVLYLFSRWGITYLSTRVEFANLLKNGLVGSVVGSRNDSKADCSVLFDVVLRDACDFGYIGVRYSPG